MITIRVERIDRGKIDVKKVWKFNLRITNQIDVFCSEFQISNRIWKDWDVIGFYDHLFPARSSLKKSDVEIPADVLDEVKREINSLINII